MIKVLIIEDEAPAVRKLKRFLEELNEPIEVIGELSTVADAILFLKKGSAIDIVFSDIELIDGNALDIYRQVTPSCPIIFTTAYNQFLMEAFETNGVAYLLKPFSYHKFERAWQKFKMLYQPTPALGNLMIEKLHSLLAQAVDKREYRTKFSIITAKGTYFLDVNDVVYLNAEDGVVFAIDQNGKNHLLPQPTLKQLEDELDPKFFFRINRAQLVHKLHIGGLERYNKNTLAIKLKTISERLITSQSTTSAFKAWIER